MTLSNDFVLQGILRLCFTRFHARMLVHYSGIPPISPALGFFELPNEPKKLDLQGAIHSTKIPTGPTGKSGPPHKVDPFFRNFSGWTEPIHWVLDRNFRKFWLNGSRPQITSLYQSKPVINEFELISFSQDGSKNRDSSTQINLINL